MYNFFLLLFQVPTLTERRQIDQGTEKPEIYLYPHACPSPSAKYIMATASFSPFLSAPAKRPINSNNIMPDPNPNYLNGSSANKRSKPQPSASAAPLPVPSGHVSFRLLCHASRIGGVIGKAGNIIKGLQQQTGAKVRIEDAPPDSPDRVITVIGQITQSAVVFSGIESAVEVSKGQEALVRVFERILEVAAESDSVAGGVVSCRMLAEVSSVGAVIGKGGKVVEKIRKDCGCRIKVLVDKLPDCAASNEEMIEVIVIYNRVFF